MGRRYYSFTLVSLVVVSLLVVASFSKSLTAAAGHTVAQRYTQFARDAATSRPGVRRSTIYPRTITYNSPHKRIVPGFTVQLKRMHFKTLTAIVPVTAPAGFLEEFFASIALKADPETGEWGSQLPQRNAFDVIQGPFRLRITSIGDTIPWSFVTDLTMKLWMCAATGVATLFETIYMDDAAKIGVQISLTLFDESSMASGSGSGSGSGSDPGSWREGSWETVTSP